MILEILQEYHMQQCVIMILSLFHNQTFPLITLVMKVTLHYKIVNNYIFTLNSLENIID